MRIWLDDLRDPAQRGVFDVLWLKSAEAAIRALSSEPIDYISFDHDLGTDLTGYDVAKFIEAACAEGRMLCPKWQIHSANPVGCDNITLAMKSAERFSKVKNTEADVINFLPGFKISNPHNLVNLNATALTREGKTVKVCWSADSLDGDIVILLTNKDHSGIQLELWGRDLIARAFPASGKEMNSFRPPEAIPDEIQEHYPLLKKVILAFMSLLDTNQGRHWPHDEPAKSYQCTPAEVKDILQRVRPEAIFALFTLLGIDLQEAPTLIQQVIIPASI